MEGNKNKNEQYGKDLSTIENINRLWSWIIIDELVCGGVSQFFISPGMRNAPLLWAVKTHPKANFQISIDERAAAFMALGYAKKSEIPACLICTSGTALANYYPAVCESYKSHTPVIVLSADRPNEMVTFNANQTINQNEFFKGFTKGFLNLGVPTEEIPAMALRKSLGHIISKSLYPSKGPVHINLPFREPLDGTCGQLSKEYINKVKNSFGNFGTWKIPCPPRTNPETLEYTLSKLKNAKSGLIVIGELTHAQANDKIRSFIEKLNWPVYLDINSNLKFEYNLQNKITPTFDHPEVYDYFKKNSPELIIHLGARLVSKHYYRFLEKESKGYKITVSEGLEIEDPSYSTNLRIQTSPDIFCEEILDLLDTQNSSIKNEDSSPWENFVKKKIDIIDQSGFSYPSLSKNLLEIIPEYSTLYLSNSTTIRSFDSYCSIKSRKKLSIQSHRGVSGIEGFMAAASGHTYASDSPVTLVIGDISFLHDLNSLMLLKETQNPVIVIVVNNGGGGIFSLLPVSKDEDLLPLLTTPHKHSLSSIVNSFGIWNDQVKTVDKFKESYLMALKRKNSSVIEVIIDNDRNVEIYKKLKTVKL